MQFRFLIAIVAILLSGPLCALENVAQGKPVVLIGEPFFFDDVQEPGEDPQLITDGNFLPLGTPWKGENEWRTVWWLDLPDRCHFNLIEPCAIEIDLQGPFRIFSFIFQGDSDSYSLEYWDDALPGWQLAWQVPTNISGGIQTRPDLPWGNPPGHVLAQAIVTGRLRITGLGEDFHYAVSEVQAFGEPFDPCIEGGGTTIGAGCWSEEPEFQTHVAAGEVCYRFELSCDGFVHGGFGACVHPNGFFDFGMNAQIGDPPGPGDPPPGPDDPGCGIGGAHMLNDKAEHSCSLDGLGKVQLKVKEVGMVHCYREE